jgi:hypothetical protein
MRLSWMLAVCAIVALAVGAYGELVLDFRTPQSSLGEAHAIASSVSIHMDDYHRLIEEMRKKYGPGAETVIKTRPPRVLTSVNGKVVEEHPALTHFSDARGLFIVGPRGRLASTFPFQIDPHQAPKPGTTGAPGVQYLKSHFAEGLPARYLQFDDRDATTDTCVTILPTDLGPLGRALKFESGIFCVVFWKGASPGSMLVGVAVANGDPWMRPFSRRICRGLTTVALRRLAATDKAPPPDYAACVLVDRPGRAGAAETLQVHAYEVRRDATLASIR